jgi:hypothetical protein
LLHVVVEQLIQIGFIRVQRILHQKQLARALWHIGPRLRSNTSKGRRYAYLRGGGGFVVVAWAQLNRLSGVGRFGATQRSALVHRASRNGATRCGDYHADTLELSPESMAATTTAGFRSIGKPMASREWGTVRRRGRRVSTGYNRNGEQRCGQDIRRRATAAEEEGRAQAELSPCG